MAKTLEDRIQRLKDYEEIRRAFAAHAYLNGTTIEFERSFAQKQPDVRFELERGGIVDGQERVRARISPPPAPPAPAAAPVPGAAPVPAVPAGPPGLPGLGVPGYGSVHYQSSFVVEVAEDGKTAQATCLSPGHVAGRGNGIGGLRPMWSYCRYGINFIREDGKWKYWRQHTHTVFNSFYYTMSWVQRSINRSLKPASGIDGIPRNADRNTSVDAPYAVFDPPRLVPHLPRPYETFNETMSFVPPPGVRDV